MASGLAQLPVLDTVNLQAVEIINSKPAAGNRSAVPMQHLSVNKLKALPGASVADALRSFSGVTIKDYGGLGGMKTVVVRSLGANHTGIFIDGVPMSDVATGQVDLGKIPLEGLEAIELNIGQGNHFCLSARAQASASMLEFRSVLPDFSRKKIRYSAGIKGGSFGIVNPFAGIYAKTGKSSFVNFSANYNSTRGDYPYLLKNGSQPDTMLKRDNADLRALNLSLGFETRFSDSSVLRVKSWLYAAERGLPGAVIYYNPWSVQRMDNRDLFSNIQYSRTSGKVQLLSNFTFTDGYLRYRDPAYLNQAGGLDNRYHQQEYYLSQAVSYSLTRVFSLGAAADAMINTMQTVLYDHVDPLRFTGLGSLSLRAETRRTEAEITLLGSLIKESKGDGGEASTRSVLSPSVSFITRLSNSPLLRLRLMYKNSFRMPTFHDLYYSLVGNPGLKPEFVNQFNAGLILLKDIGLLQLSMHTDVFYNNVKDKIVAVPSQNLFVWSMRNLGKVEIKGIEIQAGALLKLATAADLSLKLNYTHQRALDKSTPGNPTYKHQIPYIPFETLSGMLNLNGKHLGVGYNLLYNSHRYVLGENITANMLPSWWVHDLAVSWQQSLRSVEWKIKAEAINLFNERYELIKGFPMNGRGFYLTLSINY